MREIKFRAWDKAGRRMLRGGDNLMIALNGHIFWQFEYEPTEFVPRKDYEIMQFTGLKDKNGAGIYEGDIVRFDAPEISPAGGPVYKNQTGEAVYSGGNLKYGGWFEMFVETDTVCVIGNIYENPELLEDKK